MVSTQPSGIRAPHTTHAAPPHVITSRPAPWAKKIPAPKRCGDAKVFKKDAALFSSLFRCDFLSLGSSLFGLFLSLNLVDADE